MFRSDGALAILDLVPSFLIESYLPQEAGAFADALARAHRATDLADDVSYVRTTYLPIDETCLHLFEAPSAVALGEAARLAALGHLRIVEAVETE
jgi:hypothetical protein